ncbi:MAG: efflux RND transporter periplasmic adaptor subunit [Gemmatimonadota bacterium]|nr:efflux RND transporter periplasmic adaptor subunit [Gemmatimonadota bacterium]
MRVCRPLQVLSICLGLFACRGEEPPSELIRPVRFQQVFATADARVRTFSGTARAAVQSPLSFRVGGAIRQLPVSVGSAIRTGQLIAELDAQDFELRVRQADAALRQAQAQATNADAIYARTRLLYESNNASRSELDAARSTWESANAAVEAAVNMLELRRLELDYAQLRAPFDGSVSELHVEVNQNVGPGELIVTATSGDRLEVLVSVPEVLIGQIEVGSPVTVTFDALAGDYVPGTVSEVGVTPAEMATTFPVTVRLEHATDEVRPGMAAEVAFAFEATDGRERIFVPSFAVGEDREGRFVFRVEPTGDGLAVVRRCAVQVGELTSDGLEIRSGLSDGDLVVTAGVSKITDGLVVRISSPDEGPAGGGPES